jgi:hypothetical protein
LDSGKTGVKFKRIDDICTTFYPIWMQGRSKDPRIQYLTFEEAQTKLDQRRRREFKSVMMELYENGKALEGGGRLAESFGLDGDLKLDEDKIGDVDKDWLKSEGKRWKEYRKEYNKKVVSILQQAAKAPNSAHIKEHADQKMLELRESYSSLFMAPFLDEYDPTRDLFSPLQRPPEKLICLAQAIYTDGYRAAEQSLTTRKKEQEAQEDACRRHDSEAQEETSGMAMDERGQPALSFVWNVAGDVLLYLKSRRHLKGR